jgi:hypothetical protein
VNAAQQAAVPAALTAAHARALIYAQDAGLTLVPLLAVSDAATSLFGPFGPGSLNGPFGPGKYCGTERRPVVKRVGNRLKVVRLRKVHACYVPRFATSTLTVTYSADRPPCDQRTALSHPTSPCRPKLMVRCPRPRSRPSGSR